ncbi:MAG: tetratricopeptide repeat protein [Candidatus Eisenbacteria bacterium]|nr:tetratricopeptide repeat protein [Candidatus Eisenbacteria bacterium]
MTIPILSAKLGIPPLPASYLPRPRLDRLWSDWSARRLVLVTAGAGFGKTSFLAANARASSRSALWYSLDDTDADPASFFAHLAVAARALGVETAAPGDLADPGSALRLLGQITRGLREDPRGGVLVLDDAQALAGAPETLRFLGRLARFLPERATLLLASREPLDLPEARLRSLGAATRLGARELLFTAEEVEQLLARRFPGAAPDPRLCRRIVGATEGWAAGIEMLLQAAGDPCTPAIERALDQLASAGSGWFAYFAEEVVDRLEPGTRDFLRRSSVLPRLDAALCDQVLEIEGSAAVLESLERRNLFTFPVDGGGVSYRYHHLFREFLRDQLRRRAEPAELRRLEGRAAAALLAAGSWAEAAGAYAEAGDPASTLEVIEQRGEDLLAGGHYRVLRRAIESVPAAALEIRPAALAMLGRLQDIQGRWREARATYRRALRRAPAGALRVELMSLIAQVHVRQGEYAACERCCRAALRAAGPRLPALRGRIECLLGIAAAETGRPAEAEAHMERALARFRQAGDAAREGRTLFLLAANVHYYRGRFPAAKDAARRALVIFQQLKDQRRISHTLGVLGFLAMATAEEREARELTEGALRLAERLEYRLIEGYCRYTLGRCALLAGDRSGARGHFETARVIGEELEEPALLTLPRAGLAEVALAEGSRPRARALATEALATARRRGDRPQEAQCCLLLGLAGAGSRPRRVAWWRRAEEICRSLDARFELHRLLLLRLDAGDVPERAVPGTLGELLAGVAEMGHEFLLLTLEPARAARVLPRALALGIEPELAAGLLARLGSAAVPHLAPLAGHADDEVRSRAVKVLARIGGEEAVRALARVADSTTRAGRAALKAARELEVSPGAPLAIRALGPFALAVGGRELTVGAWRSGRALRLFQLLLVHRFRWVPREAILEALWPEADPAKTENNLRQSIHLLRRFLEPDLEETRLSRYARFSHDAYRLDPGHGHSYDVEAFEGALRQGLQHSDQGRRPKAEACLREAVALYRGSFLAESPYDEFAAAEREHLRHQFLRAVGHLLELTAAGGRWEECVPLARRGLAEDACGEDFHRYLVEAHLQLGSRHEALAAFHQYEQTAAAELDLPPSPRMKALAERAAALGAPAAARGRR